MERMERMERPAPLTPELNEVFLRRLKETRQSLGYGDSKVEVRFEGLNVEAEAQVGLRTPPTLLNVTLNTMQVGSAFSIYDYI
ncbi:hypothetical protein IEQ34_005483 [Dendrobium chrysotoxum]|uniref:Uncharacterized protein n=1 Tax=Dendrobium chrysotoxum TaxID=161865 RepID=A0AAV7HD48_DENCH|nr:hypothetical protein IEQ34_005483 [Dendrobium chrysotoxum]